MFMCSRQLKQVLSSTRRCYNHNNKNNNHDNNNNNHNHKIEKQRKGESYRDDTCCVSRWNFSRNAAKRKKK